LLGTFSIFTCFKTPIPSCDFTVGRSFAVGFLIFSCLLFPGDYEYWCVFLSPLLFFFRASCRFIAVCVCLFRSYEVYFRVSFQKLFGEGQQAFDWYPETRKMAIFSDHHQ
jgi:hypothetical protein